MVALLLVLLAAPDPWAVPKGGAAMLLALDESDRSYTLEGADHVWDGAQGPKHVTLKGAPLTDCRKLISEGKLEDALKAVDAELARSPAHHTARMLRGLALYKLRRNDEALRELRDAIIGNRRNPEAWSLLEMVAASVDRKVKRPEFELKSWVRQSGKQQIEIGHLERDDGSTFPWMYYGVARAGYRWEGGFARDFPGKDYRFTFREQLFALGAVVEGVKMRKKEREKISSDLRLLASKSKSRDFAAFAFFALYPEPLPARPEKHFELLRPRLIAYFDKKICVKR